MKPVITKIQGSNPSGPTDTPEADPRFGGQQSLHVVGTGLANGNALFFTGPHGPEGVRLFNLTDTECDVVAHIPVRGIYAAIFATKDSQVSDWYTFQVK